MRRSCCFASFVATTGGAEVAPRSVQWRPLGRKLPTRRPLSVGCAASAHDRDGNARKAGAAAAEAVFRHLDASLDDDDDGDVFYGQDFSLGKGDGYPSRASGEAPETHSATPSDSYAYGHQTTPQDSSRVPHTGAGPHPSHRQRVQDRGRAPGRGRGGSRAAGAPAMRGRGRGRRGGRGNSSDGGQELRDLVERVKAAVATGSWGKALAFVADARSSGLRLDGRVHTAALHAALDGGVPRSVLSTISDMRADGFVPNISLYNKAISLCGRKGMWKEAVSLLRDAQNVSAPTGRGGQQHRGPDVVTFSAAVAACRNGGEWQQALSLMEEMQAAGIQPDQIAFGTAVSACAIGGQWRRAVSLLADMRRVNLRPDVVAYSSAIKACGAEGRWEEALGLLKEMQEGGDRPNLITYTGAMEACGRAGEWSKTLGLLAEVRDQGLQPDAVTLNAVMDSLGRSGETEKALALLSTMRPARRQKKQQLASSSSVNRGAATRRSLAPQSANHKPRRAPLSAPHTAAPAAGLNSNGRRRSRGAGDGGAAAAAAEAREGRGSVRGREGGGGGGPQADVFTWSAAMTACIEGGQWQRVAAMLEEMKDDGIAPNVINYNLAVRALGKGGDWERATGLLEEMKKAGVDPDNRTFNAAIEACGRGGRWERAVSLMDDMRRQGLDPDGLTYSTVIAACSRGGAWDICLWMLEEAKEERTKGADATATATAGAKTNVFAYTAAISACGKAGHWEEAVSLLDVMREDGVPPNQVTLRAALLALENAPAAPPPAPIETRGQTSTVAGDTPPKPAPSPPAGVPAACGGAPSSEETRGRGRSSPAPPWEVAFSLLESMARGAVEGQDGVRVFPGPRDFSAGLTAACFGGARRASVVQILDLMHTCAASGSSNMPGAGAAGAAGATGDGGAHGAAAATAVSSRGNEEWGPADGRAGLIQAYNHVIRVCGDAGGTELALGLLEEMHRRALTPNAVSYAGAIIACDLAGMWREAVGLLDDMRERAGIEPDLVCYNCVVKACGSSGEFAQALGVMDTMRARCVAPDEITYSSAIAACGNSGEAKKAMELLQAMKSDGVPAGLIAHNAAIGACDKGGEWSLALSVLKEMREAGIRPDAISYAGAISSCDRAAEWRLTLGLYDQMRADMAVDSASPATDVGADATAEDNGKTTERGNEDRLVDEPAGAGPVFPPPRATLAALTACARGGQWEKAVGIIRELRGTTPGRQGERSGRGARSVGGDGGGGIDRIQAHLGQSSSLAFNAALVACAKGAEVAAEGGRDCRAVQEAALEILDMDPSPDLTGYGLAITACGFAGNVDACVGLLGEMLRGGMTPTLADYHSSLRACAMRRRPDAAQEFLESLALEGVEPDARCYRLAAEAFRRSHNNEKSEASAKVKRLLDIAERLDSGEVGEVPKELGGGGGGGGGNGGGGVDVGDLLGSLGVSGTAELQALLDGVGEVGVDSLEAC